MELRQTEKESLSSEMEIGRFNKQKEAFRLLFIFRLHTFADWHKPFLI